MNNKERLEKIQQKDLIQAISDGFLFDKDGLKTENIFRDVEWLIQQAKKAQVYEETLKYIQFQLKNGGKGKRTRITNAVDKALENND